MFKHFNRLRPTVRGWIGAIVLSLALAVPASAMRVAPMVAELTTTGVGSAARIEVGNVGSAALPFEASITRIDINAEGTIVETPADEDFLIFPPQGLVPVGGRQVVRVQWVGAVDLDVSQAYYLSVRQLPIATATDAPAVTDTVSAQVQILYTMKPLIVVAPPDARPDVQVLSVTTAEIIPPEPQAAPELPGAEAASADPVAVPATVPGVEVEITNLGKRYALLSGAIWLIDGTDLNGQPLNVRLSSSELAASVGVGYLAPAGGRRTFKVPTGQAFDPSRPITLRFTQ